MYASRWTQGWMGFALLWFLLAIAFAPTNKVYQQGMALFLWVPTLCLVWPARSRLAEVWRTQRMLCLAVLALCGWALLSMLWSQEPDLTRGPKRLLYILVFLLFFPILAGGRPERVIRLMQWGGLGLALVALLAIIRFYWLEGNPWFGRLSGLGELAHPILGGYALGLAMVWMLSWVPPSRLMRVVWCLALGVLCAFVVLCQSRGVAVALLATILTAPLWRRDRQTLLLALASLLFAIVVFWLLAPLVLERGVSYRPQIFMASLQMIAERPWTGLGLESSYRVFASDLYFDHSHNLLTHVAIELGIPGLLLWMAVWLATLSEAWRSRHTLFGQGLLGIWVFSTVAMQFDAASLTGTPRAEWFITWLPVGLALVSACARGSSGVCDKIPRST
ncbi:O-antigen ligase family protein [Pseudomonas vanderleydeniana]|uniref:O-antigen ligase family protein n=1 Tax=Pseudomonas vanderleydeniana TaxID=2745495 RepID=A0A9E6PM90_9PSED|nr:O-antigen ligase family protein [Pseudomonas vanderleydeniana]QXI29028.1 O-antigen ligase family protein [Pseudomonas vanderleydeniana]